MPGYTSVLSDISLYYSDISDKTRDTFAGYFMTVGRKE